MNFGFTTGFIDKISLIEKMNLFIEFGCQAVEINLMDFDRLPSVDNDLNKIDFDFFTYRSVHAPCRIDDKLIDYGDNEIAKGVLNRLEIFCQKFNIVNVVIHPDLVSDFSIFAWYKLPVAFENMDWLKNNYKTVTEMKNLWLQTDMKMILDVNHCLSNDPTLVLAQEMIDNFSNRIVEVHLSGFVKYHEPLFQTKQEELIRVANRLDVPVIVESICETIEEYKMENDYIRRTLSC